MQEYYLGLNHTVFAGQTKGFLVVLLISKTNEINRKTWLNTV